MTDFLFFIEHAPTPTGPMRIVTDAQGRLRALDWDDNEDRLNRLLRQRYATAIRLEAQPARSATRLALEAYFDGERAALDKLEVETGGTAFQREVWTALRKIPLGETVSYGRLAALIGRSKAVRAVGMANNKNAIAIVIPCHRVIGASGALTGYAGGLDRKLWLLRHEGAMI
jgi:methylated-DNA-[protein]-cysteine S-methyltransferase